MNAHRHRGRRAARRAADRRRRNWIVAGVAAVVVVGLGGVAAATMLGGGDDAEVATPTITRPPVTTPLGSTTATSAPSTGCRSPLTPDAPLRLWVAGDSLAYSVGNGLGKRAANTGVVAPVYESRVSSGLGSPAFFDWPKRVAEELPRLDPEVVVFVMGTNDWTVPTSAPATGGGEPAWIGAYTQSVERTVDALTTGTRTLYWVGPPVLRDAKQEAGATQVAAVIRDVVERHPRAVYVDAHDLLDADDDSYTPTIDVDGKRVQVRTGDGVHLTNDGADYLGDALFARLDEQCRVKAQAVPGAKQELVETRGSTSVAPGSTATAPPAATSPHSVAPTSPAATAPPATQTTQATAPPPTAPVTAPPTTAATTPPAPPSTVPG